MPNFSNKTVLVAGATGALGSAVVNAFLEEGARVVAVSRSAGKPSSSSRCAAVRADLTTREGAEGAVRAAVESSGRLDVLAHVMGGFAGGAPTAETEEEVWDRMMNLNLRAAFLTIRAALRPMLDQGFGRVIAVGSKAAVAPPAGLCAYAASKAGLNALIQTVAEEGRDQGVTANAVLATVIDTPDNREAMPDADFDRWVSPKGLAAQIVWLAGEASRDVNGALIPVYGRVD